MATIAHQSQIMKLNFLELFQGITRKARVLGRAFEQYQAMYHALFSPDGIARFP